MVLTFCLPRNADSPVKNFFRKLLLLLFILSCWSVKGIGAVNEKGVSGIEEEAFLNLLVGYTPSLIISDEKLIFEAEPGGEDVWDYSVNGQGFPPRESVSIVFTVADSEHFGVTDDYTTYGKELTASVETDDNGEFSLLYAQVRYKPLSSGSHMTSITHTIVGYEAIENPTLTLGNAEALPVKFLSFKAKATEKSILLSWITASEKNNNHFELEISKNPAAGFEKLVSVNSKVQNSTIPTFYNYEYHFTGAGETLYFRLKQVDTDHAFSYSKIIAQESFSKTALEVAVAQNPVSDVARLSIGTEEAGELNILVMSMNGTEIFSRSYQITEGAAMMDLPFYSVPPGMYLLAAEFKGIQKRLKIMKN